uniref:Uncharacterized protein n=1 Tax=Rhizophora mucronata TaxID=61149 RepID=A0A2P2PJX1_RHIMU
MQALLCVLLQNHCLSHLVLIVTDFLCCDCWLGVVYSYFTYLFIVFLID